jgi:soluble lytic murein transglycosylase
MTRHGVPLLMVLFAAPLTAQSPLDEAARALAADEPWRATRLVAPLLETSRTRTPDAVLLAARAAAGWEGWGSVERLLAREPWLDARFDRLGRRLLAEAALARGAAREALPHAILAVVRTDASRTDAEQGQREVMLARVQDRLDDRAEAAAGYARAATLLPTIADWLRLRAAGTTDDSTARAGLYAKVMLPAARPRIRWTEALAWNRAGDAERAAREYQALNAAGAALRVQWTAARSDSVRTALIAAALAMLRPGASAAASRDALDLLNAWKPTLSRDAQLLRARRASELGRHADAVTGYRAALEGGALADADRYRYATALGELDRWDDAAREFGRVSAPSLAGRAAYYAARAQLRAGNGAAAIAGLQRVVAEFPADTVAAGISLYLLGDLALDAARPDSARVLFEKLATRYPTASQAPRAILLGALIRYARGDATTAAADLGRAVGTRQLRGLDAEAARYWQARALARAGDSTAARGIWRELVALGPENYYAVRSAERLDTVPWRGVGTATEDPPTVHEAVERARLLDRLGMDVEARFELDHLQASTTTPSGLVAVGRTLRAHGYPARAARLGSRALAAGAPRDGDLWRLLYPLPYRDALEAAAKNADVDPFFAASVIRQESAFEPRATSPVGARGLMQVMPDVGRSLARSFGITDFDPAMLWVPNLNLGFGMRHLAEGMRRFPERERSLAAYNAGVSRVVRWSATLLDGSRASDGALDDPELFVERIPFLETRGYVRAIVRNEAVYRMIYGEARGERR